MISGHLQHRTCAARRNVLGDLDDQGLIAQGVRTSLKRGHWVSALSVSSITSSRGSLHRPLRLSSAVSEIVTACPQHLPSHRADCQVLSGKRNFFASVPARTRLLVTLYEEPDKPKQALEYIKSSLGAPTTGEFEAVVSERNTLKKRVLELEDELNKLRGTQEAAVRRLIE
eukprot:363920-Chlamydomonas_euryale.AAC.8